MKRTPREWCETCSHCGGAGKLFKQQHFALNTPEEWNDGPIALDAKHDVPEGALVCIVVGNATIFDACKEGVEIARAAGRPVAFVFNDVLALCRSDSDWEKILRVWWVKAYWETYEQSLQNR